MTKQEIWERSYELSFPRCAGRLAVCHLYRAWWYSRFESDNQFVIAQEAALRLMLEATGKPGELRELVLVEFVRIASGDAVGA
jgi:hypothetical protein